MRPAPGFDPSGHRERVANEIVAQQIPSAYVLTEPRRQLPARRAFEVAIQDKRSAKAARQWIAYVDSEIARDETLDQALPEMRQRDEDEILKNL